MNSILKFIYDNKTWLFSGIGITVLTASAWIIRLFLKKKKDSGSINNSISKTGVSIINTSKKGVNLKDTNINIINNGISLNEVKDYVNSLVAHTLQSSFELANQEAINNINLFQANVIETIEKRLNKEEFPVFISPDMFFSFNDALLTAARRDSPKKREILSNLIVDRVKNNGIETTEIIYNEAIKSISRISSDQIKLLSIIEITSSLIFLIINKEILFTEYELLETFLNEPFRIIEVDIAQLKYCGLIASTFPYEIDRSSMEVCTNKKLESIIERCKEIISSAQIIGFNQIQLTLIGKAISQTNLYSVINTEFNNFSQAPLVLADFRAKKIIATEGGLFDGDVIAFNKKIV